MKSLTIEQTIEKMKNSYGFVVILNTGKTLSLVMDDPSSLKILTAFLKKYPNIKQHIEGADEGVDPSLN